MKTKMIMKTKYPSCQKGGAAIEFAIVLPLLLLLLFGIIEFSLLMYDKAVITNASREGARTAILFNDPVVGQGRATQADVTAVVGNYCSNNLISFGASAPVVTFPPVWGGSTGQARTVRVTYRYDFLFIPNVIPSLSAGINLTAETIMRCE